jgi:hypothetical protein
MSVLITGIFAYLQTNLADQAKDRELQVAAGQKEREAMVAASQKDHDVAVAWQHDFFQFMKDNDAVIFGDDAKQRLVKRRMVLATFPPPIVEQLVHALRADTQSVEEQALLDDVAPPSPPVAGGSPPATTAPASALAPSTAPRIYIQYSEPNDLSTVEDLRTALSDAYAVPAAELVRTTGLRTAEVRHYTKDDLPAAEKIRDRVNEYFRDKKSPLGAKTMSLEGKYKNLPHNTFELWLPPLSTPIADAGAH